MTPGRGRSPPRWRPWWCRWSTGLLPSIRSLRAFVIALPCWAIWPRMPRNWASTRGISAWRATARAAGLAAATALMARDQGGPELCMQYLSIPELDDRLETPSMRAFTDTPVANRANVILTWQHYLAGQRATAYAAPARAEDLTGLPPSYVAVCEFDPLRDEGIRTPSGSSRQVFPSSCTCTRGHSTAPLGLPVRGSPSACPGTRSRRYTASCVHKGDRGCRRNTSRERPPGTSATQTTGRPNWTDDEAS